ncbi:hypothetical protein ACEPPN_010326 [Leptodophora sp. 'Broadleaf-Isolate-01']
MAQPVEAEGGIESAEFDVDMLQEPGSKPTCRPSAPVGSKAPAATWMDLDALALEQAAEQPAFHEASEYQNYSRTMAQIIKAEIGMRSSGVEFNVHREPKAGGSENQTTSDGFTVGVESDSLGTEQSGMNEISDSQSSFGSLVHPVEAGTDIESYVEMFSGDSIMPSSWSPNEIFLNFAGSEILGYLRTVIIEKTIYHVSKAWNRTGDKFFTFEADLIQGQALILNSWNFVTLTYYAGKYGG